MSRQQAKRFETRALLLAVLFFALSLTLVPRSLLQERTETLASQATKSGSFTIYRKTHYHALAVNLENNATSNVPAASFLIFDFFRGIIKLKDTTYYRPNED